MTSHPLYPNLDPAPAMPASFSKLIVEDYLRGEVGYRGVIVSDDLEMGAISALCPIGRGHRAHRRGRARPASRLPHRAGQRAAYEAVVAATAPRRSRSGSSRRAGAAGRAGRQAARARHRRRAPRGGRRRPLARAMAARAVMVVAAPDAHWRPALNGKVLAIFPRLSALADCITIEPVMQDEPRFLARPWRPTACSPTAGGERGADGRGDRARAERGRRRGRHRAVPLRRAPLQVEPGAAGGGAGGREEAGGGADARSVGRGVPRARRAASPPTAGGAASSTR